jgi:hypothetical protein
LSFNSHSIVIACPCPNENIYTNHRSPITDHRSPITEY